VVIGESDARLMVASCDGHVGLPTEGYREYLEREHHGAFDDFLAAHRYRWTVGHDDTVLSSTVFDWMRDNPRYESGGMEGLFDPVRRLKELDEDGLATEVLFPDDQNHNTPPWLVGIAPVGLDHSYDTDLRLIGARAYNRWLAEFCSTAPDRLVGAMVLGSLHNIDAAVAELRRAHASGLRHLVMLPLDYYLPLYHHPRYEPLWQACVELDLTVAVHLSDGGPDWYGDNAWDGAIYVVESFFYAHRPLWCLTLGGVLERYPQLRVAFTEQRAAWVMDVVPMMDSLARTGGAMRAAETLPLPLKPSEYFHRQCFVANSLMSRQDIEDRERIGTDVLVWGSDFPHHEGAWPTTRDKLRELFEGIPFADARAIVADNFLRAYPHVDQATLNGIATQIGPRPAELGFATDSTREEAR
jgi:predicted TIM-barrel fold metal-dependent hydrolase